jgi:hypothetical protein
MSVSVAPIPASIHNPQQWQSIAAALTRETGTAPAVTPESLTGLVGRAVPALFAADAAKDVSGLRGLFTDQVIAQCMRTAGGLGGGRPHSVSVHLVGAPPGDRTHPVIRAHVTIGVRDAEGRELVERQFWDFQLGAQVTVAASGCEGCGAPVQAGDVFCPYCGHDLRGVAAAPLAVCALKLY